ncbi:penicillin-binding protein 2 [Sulfurimonas sp. SAG-AH-194-I05]|nr:penicillin-binding protein 2 [Sulfurimonas sp. SAG-AH-194-I05]MDF1874867.1 penicillin-binding protein 2 [Sulfurimonas sp. SAG-AH-194-I05]
MLNEENKSKKILLLYLIIGAAFTIFLGVMLLTTVKPRHLPSLYSKKTSKSERGSIISADGFHIASTKKLYKAVVNNRYIDPDKRELFIQLFSIYADMDPNKVRKKLKTRKGLVVISYLIPEKQAQYLKKLSYELRRYKVFKAIANPKTGIKRTHGLSIIESGETRIYPYGDVLTPVLGYTHKAEEDGYTRIKGVKGLEKRFDIELSSRQDGSTRGKRDVNGYIILNKDSFTKPNINGLNIKLTIPISLQIKVEEMTSRMKKDLRAKEVLVAVMDSKTGKVLTVASSNRFLPKAIKKRDYPFLNAGVIEYSFESGSVIKPITFVLLLDKGRINPYDMINGHNGHYRIGKKIITDEHKFDWLSAEDVIIHSSNIGIAQMAQKLSGIEFNKGLKSFGFSRKSTPDLIYEKTGSIPTMNQLSKAIYKATCSYGYGMRTNLFQLLRAYSTFNNNGKMVNPQLVSSFIDEHNNETKLPNKQSIQVIKTSSAQKMKSILIKTVQKGTGMKARIKGLEIGGKTGTAHIVEKGQYVKKYNTSFIGFVNDGKTSLTLGAVIIQPKKSQFASRTAVPVFRKTVEIMVEDGYLKPHVIK